MASPQTTPLTARKEELNRETERYRQEIEDQVSVLKQDASTATRVALIIGGAAVGTYLIVRAVSARKKKRRAKRLRNLYPSVHPYAYAVAAPPKTKSPLVSLITNQITLFLAAIAKQKLMEAIERIGKHDHEQSTNSITIT